MGATKDFAIFKNPRFLNLGKSFWPKRVMVSDGAFFCTTELSTQGKEKWALMYRGTVIGTGIHYVGTSCMLLKIPFRI